MITQIKQAIRGKRLNLQNEKELQIELEAILLESGINFTREFYLSKTDIIDFYFPDICVGMEVKIAKAPKQIFKQLDRYTKSDQISEIILITSKTMGLPDKINEKPAHLIKLSNSWL